MERRKDQPRHLAFPLPVLAAGLITACAAGAQSGPVEQGRKNVPAFEPAFEGQTRAPASQSGITLQAETVADGLEHPWAVAVLPEGGYLVTERPGRLRVIGADGTVSDPVAGLPEVHARRQGGLLDVAVEPDFTGGGMVYWTYSKPLGGGLSATAAARGLMAEGLAEITGATDIFVQEPPSPTPMHYGSRLAFGGDGMVFVTTGEHSRPDERVHSQDLGKTYGKVIRITAEGAAPPDNPFALDDEAIDTIWSYGHRNIQGAAIHPVTDELWIVEHGPKGGDELNRIRAGGNYGWPVISYGENYSGAPVGEGITAAPGMEQPRYYWDPVIAPGGMTFYQGEMFPDWQGDLLIASLTPGGVMRLELDGDTVTGEERLFAGQGRIRDVAVDHDGALLVLTDHDDGALLRLTPAADSDG